MTPISGLKCIFDTKNQAWAMELALDGEEGETAHRFSIRGPEHVETFLEAFDDATAAHFDATSGEVVFSFDYMRVDEDAEAEDDEDYEDDEAGSDDTEEEDEAPASKRKKG